MTLAVHLPNDEPRPIFFKLSRSYARLFTHMSSKLSQLTFTMAAVCIGSILNLVAQEPGDRTETARPARDPDAVIERVSNELIFAQDGTGSREQTARIRIQSQAALQQLGVL